MTTVAHDNVQAPGTAPGPQPTIPAKGGKFGVPDLPQVSLLPPEVGHRRQVAAAQRRMIWGIIATLVVIAVGFGGAYLVQVDATIKQDEALATADQLLAQKREYSPVVQVINDIDSTTEARTFVLETEVNWPSYIYAIAAVLPEDVVIESVAITAAAAGEELVEGADPLTTNAVGVVTFSAFSPTLPVASDWIDALESIPGLDDANLQSSELQNSEGDTEYQVAATIQVTTDALQNRQFSDQADDGDGALDGAEAESADTEGGE
ncbi:PilN domain-containing protein [Demequina sp. NBRC 110056]|uniref:PilN domain-containing protein n=1 Tax=Demequina sp. NBRC 110056 TaxID=1570345 RepID=UPI000A03C8C8|nr:hypothetical protein [Demequina sp. NBRC 110056]